MTANELRGEVSIDLDGMPFVLRPSYEAVLACETATGKGLLQLTAEADAARLTLGEVRKLVTEFVRAWGKSNPFEGKADEDLGGDEIDLRASLRIAGSLSEKRVGELIFGDGIMKAMARLAIVLARAASGGCLPSGEPRPAGTMTSPIPATTGEGSQESPPTSGTGRRKSSGAARAQSSGQRSKSTGK